MSVTLKNIDDLNAQLVVEIVKNDYEPEVNKELKQIQKKVSMKLDRCRMKNFPRPIATPCSTLFPAMLISIKADQFPASLLKELSKLYLKTILLS